MDKEKLLKALGVLVFLVAFWKLTKGIVLVSLIGMIALIIYKLIRGDF